MKRRTIDDILEEIEQDIGSNGYNLYKQLRQRYGYQLLDSEMIIKAKADCVMSKKDLVTVAKFAFKLANERSGETEN